jgi:hypothetical protein
MEHIDKLNAIRYIRPNASFIMRENDIEWLDEEQALPSDSEIEAGLVSYKQWLEQNKIEKAQARIVLLDKLGITEEEAKLLLGGN